MRREKRKSWALFHDVSFSVVASFAKFAFSFAGVLDWG